MASRKDSKGRKLKDGETERKDGRYQYRYALGNGKRHTIYAKTLSELREKEQELQKDLYNNLITSSPKTTLNDIFKAYMRDKNELKLTTKNSYKFFYKSYIKDEIGSMKIKAIKYSDIRRLYSLLITDRGLKPSSVRTIHKALRPIFAFAVRDGYIASNPTEGVLKDLKKTYTCEKPKRHALTIQEQEAFINFVANSPQYNRLLPMFTVFLGTGCRVGELTGLRWEDCNFKENTISINHNLLYKAKPDGKYGFYITTPKTDAGKRIIPMLKDVKNALLFERKRQMAEGFNQNVVDGYSGFIFENINGSLYSGAAINKLINKITETINGEEALRADAENREPLVIRHFSVHSLRHTFCTRFCENETNLKVIQEIMGHANISTTMDIYAEATKEKKTESFANLEGKIKII